MSPEHDPPQPHTSVEQSASSQPSSALPPGWRTGREELPGTVVLTARGVPGCLPSLTRGPRVVTIHNAADGYGREQRAAKVARDHQALTELGFTPHSLDLREPHASTRGPASPGLDLLQSADAVWVGGGNTFVLLSLMRRSGLLRQLPDLVERGLVYVGQSAGAVAAAPHIRGAETVDAMVHERTAGSAPAEGVYAGVGLVSFFAWAHWNSRQRHRYATPPGVDPHRAVPIVGLSDHEHIVVAGSRAELHQHTACCHAESINNQGTLF